MSKNGLIPIPWLPYLQLIEFVAVILAIGAFFIDYSDRKTDRAVNRAMMLATITQVAESTKNYSGPTVIAPMLETLIEQGMDLSGLPLPRVNLQDANLNNGILINTNFQRANMIGAHLTDADVSKSFLYATDFTNAEMSGVDLTNSNLFQAYLVDANLSEAVLTKAFIATAKMNDANLNRAFLDETEMNEVDLTGANLLGANLTGANLSNANLSEANLSWANLTNVNLFNVSNLTQEQLDEACANSKSLPKNIPDGLQWRSEDCPTGRIFLALTGGLQHISTR